MRLAQLILFSGDVGRLRDFYAGALGLTVVEDTPGWIRLDAGGVLLALHALPQEPPGSPDAPREDSWWKPCFHADDVDAARAALIGAGATMREPHRWNDVVFCDGLDPDGNVFQITSR
jgi:catechol 2,3-dioxygenase-like lactoylglutathione lyase family enzyme